MQHHFWHADFLRLPQKAFIIKYHSILSFWEINFYHHMQLRIGPKGPQIIFANATFTPECVQSRVMRRTPSAEGHPEIEAEYEW